VNQRGLWSQEETLLTIGLFHSRIESKRLEPRGRIIPHPIKINNENQGPTRRDPHENNLHQQRSTMA
jgi:hypothetical protein